LAYWRISSFRSDKSVPLPRLLAANSYSFLSPSRYSSHIYVRKTGEHSIPDHIQYVGQVHNFYIPLLRGLSGIIRLMPFPSYAYRCSKTDRYTRTKFQFSFSTPLPITFYHSKTHP